MTGITRKMAETYPRHDFKHDLENGLKNRARNLKLWLNVISLLLIAGCASVKPPTVNGFLPACPFSPRCVSSEVNTPALQRVMPISFAAQSATQARAALLTVIETMGGKIQGGVKGSSGYRAEHYVAASFSSPLLGFVDDLTCRIDTQEGVIHVRSESRVGFYDLGANRRRVNELHQRLVALLADSAVDG